MMNTNDGLDSIGFFVLYVSIFFAILIAFCLPWFLANKKTAVANSTDDDIVPNKLTNSWRQEVTRGIELLHLCADLQSEKDGIDRAKTVDQFARDIETAATNMAALNKLFPLLNDLADLGRKLEADGKITVDYGDDFADAALNYVMREHGLKPTNHM